MIKRLIGKLTLPKNAEQCESGDWWIPVSGMPSGEYVVTRAGHVELLSFDYPHNYRQLEQDWLGVWRVVQVYIGRCHSLAFYRNQCS